MLFDCFHVPVRSAGAGELDVVAAWLAELDAAFEPAELAAGVEEPQPARVRAAMRTIGAMTFFMEKESHVMAYLEPVRN